MIFFSKNPIKFCDISKSPFEILSEYGIKYSDARNYYWNYYSKNINCASCFPQIPEVLYELHENNHELGVVSSLASKYCNELLQLNKISFYFKIVVGYHQTHKHKPFPNPISYCIDQLSGDKESSYYIGDNFKDIIAAKGAGIHSVAALWGIDSVDEINKILAQEPDFILKIPMEVLTLLSNKDF